MTLYSLSQQLMNLAQTEHVNSTFQGDIYELNKQQDIEYPAFVITQGVHLSNNANETETFVFNMFLVDRLTEDKSNEIDVQDWANNGLQSILRLVEDTGLGLVTGNSNITTFTERFDSLCAGAYVTANIQVDNRNCNKPGFVTSVNGMTGDVYIEGLDPDAYYTKIEANEKFNPRDNFKTINNESIIGKGNIEIEAGVDISDETVKGIDTSTEIYLTTDEDGKLMIGKFSPIKIGTVSGGSTNEIGQTVTTVTIKWGYTAGSPVSQTVDGASVAANLRELTISGSWSGAKTFTVRGVDAKGNSSSGSTSLSFYLKKYYGVSEKAELTNADVLGLTNQPWATSRAIAQTSFNCSGGKYPWICLPKSLGTPSFIVGGLPNSDFVSQEIQLTNASGHTEEYLLWRTKYVQTGSDIKIEVK